MEILSQWITGPGNEANPWLTAASTPLTALAPPLLTQFQETLARREAFIRQHIDRKRLAQDLRQSNQRRGAPESVLKQIDRLAEPEVYLVVAGQQPGLLGGPLYTLYKIIHAIVLSHRLTAETDKLHLPAFWNASEDHDFTEISQLGWLSKENRFETFAWEMKGKDRPYYRIPARECPLEGILDFIRRHSHPTEFMEAMLERIHLAHARAESYPDFFDALLWDLFEQEGLIILRPDDRVLRDAAVPHLREEILQARLTAAEINAAGKQLEEMNLPSPIHKRADRTSFFLIQDGVRLAIYGEEQAFHDNQGRTYSTPEMLDLLESDPTAFSPSAVLRPVIQDAVLPVSAVILGPNELAYHFLLHPVYQRHGVPRPCVVPRFGCTAIEARFYKWMERYELSPGDLTGDPAARIKELVRKASGEEGTALRNAATEQVNAYFTHLQNRAQHADAGMLPALEKNRFRMLKELEGAENLVLRREADRQEVLRNQVEALHAALFPKSQLQERCFNIFYYLVKYGPAFLNDLKEIAAAFMPGSHYFIKVP